MNIELELLLSKKEIIELKVIILQTQHKELMETISLKQQEIEKLNIESQ
jgi:hypothetical protein